MGKPALDIGQLSREERLELIEDLWESLNEEERDSLPLTPLQVEELDRRLDALDQEGPVGISSEELLARVKPRPS